MKKTDGGARYGVHGIARHLRRRTKSHNPYKHSLRPNAKKQAALLEHKQKLEANTGVGDGGSEKDKNTAAVDSTGPDGGTTSLHPPFTNRKMRRRPGLLIEAALLNARWTEAAILASLSPSPPPRRLETHIWHSKRLAMQELWPGWVLPEGETGRGRGSRAFARRLTTGAVLHDASYWCPFLLSGPIDDVIGVLRQLLDPEIACDVAAEAEIVLIEGRGWEIEGMMYEPTSSVPHSAALGPVRITRIEKAKDPEELEDAVKHLELYVWSHGAAAAQALAALRAAICNWKGAGDSVDLRVMDLRRLEIRGSGADIAIARALFKFQSSAEKETPCLPSVLRKLRFAGQAAAETLLDPRLAAPMTLGTTSFSLLDAADLVSQASSTLSNQNLINPGHPYPISEASVSQIRQAARQHVVQGETPETIAAAVRDSEAFSRQGVAMSCSAVFIRQRCRFSGWSIILPPGWVAPIWNALVFSGACAAGQREWRWLHTLDQSPFFPHDAPDTVAYASLRKKRAEEQSQRVKSRPKGRITLPKEFEWDWVQTLREGQSADDISHIQDVMEWLGCKPDTRKPSEAKELTSTTEAMKIDSEQQEKEKEEEISNQQLFIARSEASMLEAVFGPDAIDGGPICSGLAARPVVNALTSTRLQWAVRQVQPPLTTTSKEPICLVHIEVQIIKRGTAAEGAMVCVIRGEEADRSSQPCYVQCKTNSGARSNRREVEEEELFLEVDEDYRRIPAENLIPIGFVTSPAPYGTGRTTVSLAACSAAAFWRLRSLQFYEPLRDRGTVQAWIVNPGSTAIFPVRLSLQVERKR